MAQKSNENWDGRFKNTYERLKNKPQFKSDFLDALYNQITRGDFEDGKHYDCSDNCMRIWKGKKGLPTDQLKEMYVEVANQLLPELDSQPKISSDLIPPPISQSSSTGANPVSRNVSDL